MFTRVDQIEGQVDASQPFTLPAPTGGINARDALDRMPAQDAVSLVNWIPDYDAVRVRKGRTEHATMASVTGDVEALFGYEGFSTQKVIAAKGGSLFDVTTAGAGTSIGSGYSSNDWIGAVYNDYLVLVNGEDAPIRYDGSSIAAATFTGSGLTPSNLNYVEVYNQRLFFVEKNTANLWYGDAGAVTGGTLSLFDVGQVAQHGGYLQALATWSFDGGEDIRDYLVLIMSTGEIIVYSGTNPSDAAAWSRRASYKTSGAPVRRCAVKIGGDVVILTREGLVPLSALAKRGSLADVDADPVYGKIRRLFRDAMAQFSTRSGWYPHRTETGELVIFNVPDKVGGNEINKQYILNSATGAWAEWDFDATAWTSIGGVLYLAVGGTVYTNTGRTDDGTAISVLAETAFVRLRNSGRKKQVTSVRPYILLDQNETAAIEVNVDYARDEYTDLNRTLTAVDASGIWDVATWDTAFWGPKTSPYNSWLTVGKTGVTFSVYMRLNLSGEDYEWRGVDLLAQDGGIF